MARTPSTINVKIARKKSGLQVTCKELPRMVFEVANMHELRQKMELLPKIILDHWHMEHKTRCPLREFVEEPKREESTPSKPRMGIPSQMDDGLD